jgi:hypothetical protein
VSASCVSLARGRHSGSFSTKLTRSVLGLCCCLSLADLDPKLLYVVIASGFLLLLAVVTTNVYVFAPKPQLPPLPPVWQCHGFWLPVTNSCYAGDVTKCNNPGFCFVFQLGQCFNCSDIVKANTPTPFPTHATPAPVPSLI